MKRPFTALPLLLLAITLNACSRSAPPPAPPAKPPPTPTLFPIDDTSTIVTPEEIPTDAGRAPIVRADFNADRLEDIAVAETDAGGEPRVGIYLQRSGPDLPRAYYRAGGIRQAGDYKISAIMSQNRGPNTDLLVMFAFTDGRRELVQFQSDGKAFSEVLRKAIASAPPPSPPTTP